MTDPVSVAAASVAAGLSAVLGWMFWPTAPDLDGERWFKLQLATLLLGHVDASGGGTDDWMRAVVAGVPFHPAGREPERKVAGLAPGTTSVEGERALCEKLAAISERSARWAWMYDLDEVALAARLDDPEALGPAYDPAVCLGPLAGWESLQNWGAGESQAFPEAVARTLQAVWILVESENSETPGVLTALALMGLRCITVPAAAWGDSLPVEVFLALREPSTRAVLVGEGEAIHTVLRALAGDATLRDRTLGVVSLGGDLSGPAHRDWMGAHFTHHRLDTEITRLTPYFAIQWLDRDADPPGAFGVPLAHARFPEPKLEAMTQETVQTVNLGVLPWDSDPLLVAHGVVALVGSWVAVHKSG